MKYVVKDQTDSHRLSSDPQPPMHTSSSPSCFKTLLRRIQKGKVQTLLTDTRCLQEKYKASYAAVHWGEHSSYGAESALRIGLGDLLSRARTSWGNTTPSQMRKRETKLLGTEEKGAGIEHKPIVSTTPEVEAGGSLEQRGLRGKKRPINMFYNIQHNTSMDYQRTTEIISSANRYCDYKPNCFKCLE